MTNNRKAKKMEITLTELVGAVRGHNSSTTEETVANGLVGLRVLVRTHNSGVSIGKLDSARVVGSMVEITLSDSIRVWRWTGAFTCSELAANGGTCRIARHPDGVTLLEQAAEILPVAVKAWEKIEANWTEGAE